MRTSVSFLVGAALLAAPSVAGAQTAPASSAAQHQGTGHHWTGEAPAGAAVHALRFAYAAIGHAEAAGGNGAYLDAARASYREALARNTSFDTHGSIALAEAAASLARAATALVPPPVPHDVPAPPAAPVDGGLRGPGGPAEGPPRGGEKRGEWGGEHAGGPPQGGGFGRRGGGEEGIGGLAHLAAIANTDEAKRFANDALNANLAAERAAFAGNHEEASRQHRLAGDLARAVRALAAVNLKPPASPATH